MKGLDTNVLLRFILRDDAKQAKQADEFVERWCTAASPCRINRLVLAELVWVLESAYRYARDDVAAVLDQLLLTAAFDIEDRDFARAALQAYRLTTVDFSDALIAKCNRQAGCDRTGTFDRAAGALEEFELLK